MDNVLIILHGDDIGPARQLAATLDACRVLTFDPILLDRIRLAGLAQAELVLWPDAPSFNDTDAAAHDLAYHFERRLQPLIQRAVPGLSVEGWQHYNLYFLFSALLWNRAIWPAMLERLAGSKLYLFICDTPLAYYFNSFVPSTMLMAQATRLGIEIAPFTYKPKDDSLTRRVPALHEVRPAGEANLLLAHLPTCMYDIRHFNGELAASGKKVVNVQGKYFNMPVAAHETIGTVDWDEVLPHLPPLWASQLPALQRALAGEIDSILAEYLHLPHFRQRQAEHLSEVYCGQLVMLALLDRHFQHSKPERLLLVDHDTDYHGPLIAFARRHQLPVLYVPHSKTTSDIFFDYPNLTCLTHPIQGDLVLRPDGRRAAQATLAFPEQFEFATLPLRPLAKVGILLQAVSLNGVYCTDLRPYLDGLKRMVDWCRDNGLAFTLRCKPAYFLISMLEEELGLDRDMLMAAVHMPMAEYAASCDLCLMYDAPTSAELEFLNRGIPVLNPVIKDMTNVEGMVADPAIIPRSSVTQALRTATTLLRDPAALDHFRRRQFAAYVTAYRDAQPLRVYLENPTSGRQP